MVFIGHAWRYQRSVLGIYVPVFYKNIANAFAEPFSEANLEKNRNSIKPWHVNQRINAEHVKDYSEIYKTLIENCLFKRWDSA